jgi:nicotinamide mononucleotide transporter
MLLTTLEIIATLTGVGFAILAAMRNRLCWIAGAVSSALVAVLSGMAKLPMQSALQVFFVGMALYGWWSWTRSSSEGELQIGRWPLLRHLGVGVALTVLSLASARLLARETDEAWPLLDSFTTWFSLFATWLQARGLLENWLYWIVIDALLMFLFYERERPFLALLNLLFIGIAAAGFVAWRRRLTLQAVPA